MEKMIVVRFSIGEQTQTHMFPEDTPLEDVLVAIPNLPQALIDQLTNDETTVANFQLLPDWVKTISPDDAALYVHDNVLNGFDQAAFDALIDTRFQGVTTFAAAAPLILQTFKQIGGELIALRDLIGFIVKLLMYMRDLIIKYRQAQ